MVVLLAERPLDDRIALMDDHSTAKVDDAALPGPRPGDRLTVRHHTGTAIIEVFDPMEGEFTEPIALPRPPEGPTLDEVERYLLDNRFRIVGQWHSLGHEQLIADVEFIGFSEGSPEALGAVPRIALGNALLTVTESE